MAIHKLGRLIIVEGMDGVGKTTQVERLFERLGGEESGYVKVAEPGGTPMGMHLRQILLADDVRLNSEEMLLMFTLQREYLMRTVVEPAVNAGRSVIADRSIVSTLVYQTQYGLTAERILEVSRVVIEMLRWIPRELFVIDVPPEVALRRVHGVSDDIARTTNHFDRAGLDEYVQRRSRYLQAPSILGWQYHVIDGTQERDAITEQMLGILEKRQEARQE